MAGLLDPQDLDLLATELYRDEADLRHRLGMLRALVLRREAGVVNALTETRIEQSFNERIFSEFFGYATLLRDGMGVFHLYPKRRHPSGRFDDFSLGFFAEGDDVVIGTAEFKDPGTNLEAPQGGSYGGVSPVAQGFRAAAKSGASWVIVSNFDEIRLYHASDPSRFNAIRLSEILTVAEVRRALTLFGRRALLGSDRHRISPLQRLFRGERVLHMDQHPGAQRLLHEAFTTTPVTLPYHRLDDGLASALALVTNEDSTWPRVRPAPFSFALEDGRISLSSRIDDSSPELTRVEFAQSGVLRLWEAVDLVHDSRVGTKVLEAESLPDRVGLFILLARRAFTEAAATNGVAFRWKLHDLEKDAKLTAPADWLGTTGERRVLRVPGDRQPTVASGAPALDRLTADGLANTVAPVVRELLYPYEYVPSGMSLIGRTRATPAQCDTVLRSAKSLVD